VTLTQMQKKMCEHVGELRLQRNWKHYGIIDHPNPRDDNVMGVMGEFVVAQTYNLCWDPDDSGGGNDVGGILEVRARRHLTIGPDLGIRPLDIEKNADKPYVLVHAENMPTLWLIGWALAREGISRGNWNERSRAWFIDPARLHSLDDLFDFVEEQRMFSPTQRRSA